MFIAWFPLAASAGSPALDSPEVCFLPTRQSSRPSLPAQVHPRTSPGFPAEETQLQRFGRPGRTQAVCGVCAKLRRQDWVVYAKAAFGGPVAVLRYLGRYTHRVAISNHRIVAHEGDQVTFRWRDYARGNKQRLMTLSAEEFLRRFVQHILPRGFVRIRQFGFLANGCRSTLIAVSRQLLAFTQTFAHHLRNSQRRSSGSAPMVVLPCTSRRSFRPFNSKGGVHHSSTPLNNSLSQLDATTCAHTPAHTCALSRECIAPALPASSLQPIRQLTSASSASRL